MMARADSWPMRRNSSFRNTRTRISILVSSSLLSPCWFWLCRSVTLVVSNVLARFCDLVVFRVLARSSALVVSLGAARSLVTVAYLWTAILRASFPNTLPGMALLLPAPPRCATQHTDRVRTSLSCISSRPGRGVPSLRPSMQRLLPSVLSC